jgi:hypothetical protein
MTRVRSFLGPISLAFCTLFAIGCIAETNEPSEESVWYNSKDGKCYTEDVEGNRVEVACDDNQAPANETLDFVPCNTLPGGQCTYPLYRDGKDSH